MHQYYYSSNILTHQTLFPFHRCFCSILCQNDLNCFHFVLGGLLLIGPMQHF